MATSPSDLQTKGTPPEKPSHPTHAVFDEPNLVSAAGLVPVLRLAESAGFHNSVEAVTVPSPNAAVKTAGVVGGMLAGLPASTTSTWCGTARWAGCFAESGRR